LQTDQKRPAAVKQPFFRVSSCAFSFDVTADTSILQKEILYLRKASDKVQCHSCMESLVVSYRAREHCTMDYFKKINSCFKKAPLYFSVSTGL